MKDSTKLILSEQNHQIYQCREEEVFEQLFEKPYDLLSLTKSKRIDFQETVQESPEDDFGNSIENCASMIDNESLAKNMGKPYVFIALKQYQDKTEPGHSDDPAQSGSSNFAPLMNLQDTQYQNDQVTRMQSMSFAQTKFALENMIDDF